MLLLLNPLRKRKRRRGERWTGREEGEEQRKRV